LAAATSFIQSPEVSRGDVSSPFAARPPEIILSSPRFVAGESTAFKQLPLESPRKQLPLESPRKQPPIESPRKQPPQPPLDKQPPLPSPRKEESVLSPPKEGAFLRVKKRLSRKSRSRSKSKSPPRSGLKEKKEIYWK
jgi:hypothetical protein